MNFFINALSAKRGGGQAYIVHLLENLDIRKEDQFYIIHSPQFVIKDYFWLKKVKINSPTDNPYLRPFWEFFILPFLLFFYKIDVLFCPGGVVSTRILPFHHCKVVTMFRNMAPYDKRLYESVKGVTRLRLFILKKIFITSMKRANAVIFISNFARSFIKESMNVRVKKDKVIPHGISPYRLNISEEIKIPFFLYVSIFDYYKHQEEVAMAFDIFKQKNPGAPHQLFLVGLHETSYGAFVKGKIKNLKHKDDIVLLGNLPFDNIQSLYPRAFANIFASSCENCPNILLEMLNAKRPIVVSNLDPMPEFAGEAALYFNPKEPETLAQRMNELNNNPELIHEYAVKSSDRAMLYRWDRTAKETYDFLIHS